MFPGFRVGCIFEDTIFSRDSPGSHLEQSGLGGAAGPSLTSMDIGEACWICFDETNGAHQLDSPCNCPRKVHRACLARWQLQQAGKYEEQFCRWVHTKKV